MMPECDRRPLLAGHPVVVFQLDATASRRVVDHDHDSPVALIDGILQVVRGWTAGNGEAQWSTSRPLARANPSQACSTVSPTVRRGIAGASMPMGGVRLEGSGCDPTGRRKCSRARRRRAGATPP